ncbi:MAG TPA: hypothetical protein VKI65_19345 [Gemmataceae bacterium]|nr:hypothetical protein [Gemmataceae bacterium]
MRTSLRRWRLAGLIVAGIATLGCNPVTMSYFLLFGTESKLPPKFHLAPKEKDLQVRVVILASSGLETRPEFLRVDRELATLVARELQQGCKKNREEVVVVPTSQVEKFKDKNPNWRTLTAAEIGEKLSADYVIDLEINSLSLYEQGSHNTLYHGRAEISVNVTDVHDPDAKAFTDEYKCEFPRGRPVPADDSSPQQFRMQFLNRIARDLAWLFTAHPVEEDYHNMD